MSDDCACATCGEPVENTAVTGIFCSRCHEEQEAAPPSWRDYFNGPAGIGLTAAMVPFVFHITVNGVGFVALAGGIVAPAAGALGLLSASRRGKPGRKAMIGAGLAVLLGLYHLWASAFWLMLA